MKPKWKISDISKEIKFRSDILEFQDQGGNYHDFNIVVTESRIVFGGVTNTGFIESGYINRENYESIDDTLQELLEDLETYYNDGYNYCNRIICNDRM